MEALATQGNMWWGTFTVGTEETLLWELGAVRFALQRHELEWRIAVIEQQAGEQKEWTMASLETLPPAFDDAWERYVCGQDYHSLHIMPVLADRSVVSRPSTPFTLLPGKDVRIYVSTPLWVKITTDEKNIMLKEFSLLPLSDTWFGPSTQVGELCYASRTHARLTLNAMPLDAHRATTVLVLKNRAETPLILERLNLPVTHLGLYQNDDGQLWTEEIELVRDEDSDSAEVKIKPGPPAVVKGAKRLVHARKKAEGGLLIRALGSLFG